MDHIGPILKCNYDARYIRKVEMTQVQKPKVLFLVHVEEGFRGYFPDDMYTHRLYRSAKAQKYDRVIILDSELGEPGPNGEPGGVIRELRHAPAEIWSWSYGYEPGMWYDDDPDNDWVIESDGHEWTWIPTEIRDELIYFQNAEVYIGGGCDGECLADWETVLSHMDIDHTRIEGLIYSAFTRR
jgi:hypothetical protein